MTIKPRETGGVDNITETRILSNGPVRLQSGDVDSSVSLIVESLLLLLLPALVGRTSFRRFIGRSSSSSSLLFRPATLEVDEEGPCDEDTDLLPPRLAAVRFRTRFLFGISTVSQRRSAFH